MLQRHTSRSRPLATAIALVDATSPVNAPVIPGIAPGPEPSPTSPTLSTWYSASANALSGVGSSGMTVFYTLAPAGAGLLSGLIGVFNVTISEFSFAMVIRAVVAGDRASLGRYRQTPHRRRDAQHAAMVVYLDRTPTPAASLDGTAFRLDLQAEWRCRR